MNEETPITNRHNKRKIMRQLLFILGLVGCLVCIQAEGLRVAEGQAEELCVVSYNLENLFHPKHDTVVERVRGLEVRELGVTGYGLPVTGERLVEKDDWEWTPDGERRWSYSRYYRKVENIARVLTNIGEWKGVDVVGLQEVENALCVKRLCNTLRRGEYDFVHYESPDRRGIDVALIYKKSRIDTIATRAIRVSASLNGERVRLEDGQSPTGRDEVATELRTRDILYVCAQIKGLKKEQADTIHFFVCHLPSQRGGKAESEWKRNVAKRVLQQAVDSVYGIDPNAKIIVMGDMNSGPVEDLKGLTNKMLKETFLCGAVTDFLPLQRKDAPGTHKYQGRWTYLDHFYVSPSIDSLSQAQVYDAEWIQETDEKYMGLKPKRTYNGYRYQNGYSDHLPIILRVR